MIPVYPKELDVVAAYNKLFHNHKTTPWEITTLKNGIRIIHFSAWKGVTSHPKIHDQTDHNVTMWVYCCITHVCLGMMDEERKFFKYEKIGGARIWS